MEKAGLIARPSAIRLCRQSKSGKPESLPLVGSVVVVLLLRDELFGVSDLLQFNQKQPYADAAPWRPLLLTLSPAGVLS